MYNPFRHTVIFVFCCVAVINANGQSQTPKKMESISETWLNYYNQTRLSKRWGFWFDMQLYSKDHMVNWPSQVEVRPGITYYFTDDARLTAGYSFINYFPGEGHEHISQQEHRPWQQFQWYTRYRKFRIMQWVRLEERFVRKIKNDDSLAAGYNFNYRVRYNMFFTIPLANDKSTLSRFAFTVGDELYLNFGSRIVNNYFDQNRIFIGGSYKTNAHDNLQAGYLHIFQELSATNNYKRMEIFRISYFHNLDLRNTVVHKPDNTE